MIASVAVTTVGSTGAAEGTANSEGLAGILRGVRYVPTSQHANTDVVIAEVGGLGRTLLTLTNAGNTAANYYPALQNHDAAGAAITGSYSPIHLSGFPLSVTVAQGNSGAPGVTVYFDVEPD